MKVSVDVDCTPEEARRLMGLPDLTSLHESYLARMRAMIDQGLTPDALQAIMQNWAPMGEAGLAMWRQMIERVGGASIK